MDSFSSSIGRGLEQCEAEPISTPGAVQSHGLFLVLDSDTYLIEQVGVNLIDLLGLEPADVVGRPVSDLIVEADVERALSLISQADSTFVNPFSISLCHADGEPHAFNAIAHSIEGGISILELEPLSIQVVEDGSLEAYLHLVQGSLGSTDELGSVEGIAASIARRVKEFTGFDRVMIYRFAPDFHGEVIAEELEEGMEPYLHLHYPASDIPPQARALYLENWVRLLYDVDAPAAPLYPAQHPRFDTPLPMNRAVLRAMSPYHLQYLRNMGVRSTLTVSLIVGGRLWGLIACHHRTPHFVSYGTRATVSVYGVVMSGQIARTEKAHYQKALSSGSQALHQVLKSLDVRNNLVEEICPHLQEIREVFEADGVIYLDEEVMESSGSCPAADSIREALPCLAKRSGGESVISSSVKEDWPELSDPLPAGAGFIAIPFGIDSWLLMFRQEMISTVRWAGDPGRPVEISGDGVLNPRASFSEWRQEVKGQSLPWPEHTGILIDELRGGLAGFLVEKTRHLESVNQELQHFAGVIAHEVKSEIQAPLMALGIVSEIPAVAESKRVAELISISSASLKTLAAFSSEMLDFAKADSANQELEEVDLKELVDQVRHQMERSTGTEEKSLNVVVVDTPRIITSRGQLHYLISNLIRNSVIHGPMDGQSDFMIEVGTTPGLGAFFVRDNGRGILEEDQERIFEYFYRGSTKNERPGSGIGLGFARRLLERGGGRIWVESKPRLGASFYFTLPGLSKVNW